MATKNGAKCPACKGEGSQTAMVALVPLVVKDKVIEPHTYAVCSDCYEKQFEEVYGLNFKEYKASRGK